MKYYIAACDYYGNTYGPGRILVIHDVDKDAYIPVMSGEEISKNGMELVQFTGPEEVVKKWPTWKKSSLWEVKGPVRWLTWPEYLKLCGKFRKRWDPQTREYMIAKSILKK